MHTQFLSENAKEREHSEDLGVDERLILEWFLGREWENTDWVHLTYDKDQGRALMNTEMSIRIST
jgi:hypothetical protein